MSVELIVKKELSRALEELLGDKDLEKVSVVDICRRAGVSRSTFYHHFQDKFALANWTLELILSQITEGTPSARGKEMVFPLVNGLFEKQELIRKLLRYTGQNSFADFFVQRSFEYSLREMNPPRTREMLSEQEWLEITYANYGATQLMLTWLLEGCKVDAREVAHVINECRPASVKALFGE